MARADLTAYGACDRFRTGAALRVNAPPTRDVFYQGDGMTAHTYKLVELVGSSTNSTDEAIRNAIQKASATIKHIDWFQVIETRGHVQDGRVAHFQATLKVGFRIEP